MTKIPSRILPFGGNYFARRERNELSQLFGEVGPDAPTLCEGWDTKDLVVHLVLREYRPDAAAGMFVKGLRPRLESVTADLEKQNFSDLVAQFHSGPPLWSPFRLVDRWMNAAENFIHHEDVRRGGGDTTPRPLAADDQMFLWRLVKIVGKAMLQGSHTPLTFQWKIHPDSHVIDTYDVVTKAPSSGTPGDDDPRGIISGDPGEILLWIYGREEAANVTLEWVGEGAEAGLRKAQM